MGPPALSCCASARSFGDIVDNCMSLLVAKLDVDESSIAIGGIGLGHIGSGTTMLDRFVAYCAGDGDARVPITAHD